MRRPISALMYVNYSLPPHEFNHAAMSAAHLKDENIPP